MANPEKLHADTYPNRKSPYESVEEQMAAEAEALDAWFTGLLVWFGPVMTAFARISDPRNPKRIKHQLVVVLVFGVLLFLTQCTSRREGNRQLTEPKSWTTLQAAFPQLDSVPHMDTVANVLEQIPPSEVEAVLTDTIKRLLRNRRLKNWMVQQRYLIAIDGTLKWSGVEQHAEEMLEKHSANGATIYQVYGVEAVLVGPQGIAIPFLTEFCANSEERTEETKQDSELKAFRRLAKRLRALFPKLPLTILADGLYPNGPLFALLRAYRWDFMIVLQAGNLPTWQDDARRMHKLERHNTVAAPWGDRSQKIWWVNNVPYDWYDPEDKKWHTTVLHFVQCVETWTDAAGDHQSTWTWVSGKPFTRANVLDRCNRMARHRWDIEEHILVEKHLGYEYKHLYSRDWNAMQGFHHLMHIAHLLHILVLHQTTLYPMVQRLTIRGTIKKLIEAARDSGVDKARIARLGERQHKPRLVW